MTALLASACVLSAGFPELARSATEARLANRASDAIRLYRHAVAAKPTWDEGWWYLGALLHDQGRYSEAKTALRRYVELKPGSGPGWGLLGLCEYETKEYAAAAAHLTTAAELGAGENEQFTRLVKYRAGVLLTRFERYDAAVRLLSSIGAGHKNSQDIMLAAGLAGLRMPLFPAQVKPEQREMVLLAGRGILALGAGNAPAARAALEMLATIYPKQPNVHYLYGSLLVGTEPDAAMEAFRREIEISPEHVPALVALSLELTRRNDVANAIPHARIAATAAPTDFNARYAYGRALLAAGRAGQATVELEAAAKLRPEMAETFLSLSRAYQILKRPKEAEAARRAFHDLSRQARQMR